MKKWLAMLMISGASMAGLVACNNSEEVDSGSDQTNEVGSEEENQEVTEKTEIKLWMDEVAVGEKFEELIEEALPHIDITFESVSPMVSQQKIALDGPAGIGADVFLTAHNAISLLLDEQLLLPLGSEMGEMIEETYLSNVVDMAKADGEYYGIPQTTESIALFYNKTLLDEYGFEVATDFEIVKEQAAQYNTPEESKFLMHFSPGNAYDMHFFLTSQGFEIFGPNHNDPEQVNITSPEFVNGLKELEKMKEALPVPAQDLSTADNLQSRFAKGELPYVITGPWAMNEIKEGAEANDFEFGVTTIPTVNGNEAITYSGNIVAAISSYTEHPEEAKEVLEFINSEEALNVLYDMTGRIPALNDLTGIDGILEDPHIAGILEQVKTSEPTPNISEMASYWVPVQNALASVWDGLATPEEAAEKAMADYETAQEILEN